MQEDENNVILLATTDRKENHAPMLKNLMERRVPQILGLYIAGGWGIVQFVDWIISRFMLSPHLVDLSLISVISFIPSIIILAYFHGRPGKDEWTTIEKIGIPVNLIATVFLLFVMFSPRDLGAITTTVTVEDQDGNQIERIIPKSEFRKSLAIFFFENESADTTLNWMQYGIPSFLDTDLEQDIFISSDEQMVFIWAVEDAGFDELIGIPLSLKLKVSKKLHKQFFLTGKINFKEKLIRVDTRFYEAERGKLIATHSYTDSDMFAVVDQISVDLKIDMGLSEKHIEESIDLPITEITTNSMEAAKNAIYGNIHFSLQDDYQNAVEYYQKSTNADPEHCQAYFMKFISYLMLNKGEDIYKESALKMMKYRYKIPENSRFEFEEIYYKIFMQPEKAFKVVKMWTELYPDNIDAHRSLANNYIDRGNIDKVIEEYKILVKIDPENHSYLITIGWQYMRLGNYHKALEYFEKYAKKFPEEAKSYSNLGSFYKEQGEFEEAKKYYQKAQLIEPEEIGFTDELGDMEIRMGNFKKGLEIYVDALDEIAEKPEDSSRIYYSLESYYISKGKYKKSIELMHERYELQKNYIAPINMFFKKAENIHRYAHIGLEVTAFQIIQELESQMLPPFNAWIPAMGNSIIYTVIENPDSLEKYTVSLDKIVKEYEMRSFKNQILFNKGEIHRFRGEYEQAIDQFEGILEINASWNYLYGEIGKCYREMKKYKQSLTNFNRFLKHEPYNAELHYEMALLFEQMGNLGKAREHLKFTLDLWEDADPEYKKAGEAKEKWTEWQQEMN